MLTNNPQRHHVSGHVMYHQQPTSVVYHPHHHQQQQQQQQQQQHHHHHHYALAPTSHYDFAGHVDPVLGAYRGQHSLYARDDYAHQHQQQHQQLAPHLLPAHQHQHQQHHSTLPPQTYTTAASTTFRPYEHTLTHRSRAIDHSSYRPLAAPICAAPSSATMDDEQYAQMQQLSADFEPEAKGPLAGELQPSNVIVQEYSTADPIYQRKSVSLASTYSHLRTIRGDGQCGWRAVAFAYFERLISSRDPNHLLQAETRLRSLVNLIKNAGIAADIYDDFSIETYNLLRDLSDALRTSSADAVLLERFNDETAQNYIITQLKSLTTAWMKSHVDEYSNFLLDLNIESYCEQHIMPLKAQMDQVSLMALKDVLLAPAGIGLEVEYLDLSPGQDGTLHQLTRADQNIDMGIVRLLYRPGHYDILYKSEDLAPPPVAAYLQFSPQTYNDPISELSHPDFMYMIPGMSGVHQSHDGWAAASNLDMSDFFEIATPQQPCPQPMITPCATMSKAPVRAIQQPSYYMPPQPMPVIAPHEPADDYVIRTANLQPPSRPPVIAGGPFRLTDWHHKQDTTNTPTAQVQLQTTQFKNSHYNPAHFNNPDFQPETWSPEKERDRGGFDEHIGTSKNGRHRKSR